MATQQKQFEERGQWLKNNPPQYSVTVHGLTFTLNSSVQVARMEQRLAVMTYSQIAKLHREIYGSTPTASRGVKVRNG
jgi:hypothetical protein